jgi:hypothetical protein
MPMHLPTQFSYRHSLPIVMASLLDNSGTGSVWWGPFCDHPSGPQQYFSTKLPTESRFLGSRLAVIPIFVNFARCEVCTVSLSRHYCNSSLGYLRQVLMPYEEEKLTSSRSSSTADHGVWPLDFNNKNRLKKSSDVII